MHNNAWYGGICLYDIEKHLHDNVFIQSIDRKERMYKFLISNFNIPEQFARDDSMVKDMLEQLIREKNAMLEGLEDEISIYLSEASEDEAEVNGYNLRNANINNSFFDRNKAKLYIDTYWKNYNPAYPSFASGGGDCANFVSQILYAGGMPWVDNKNPANYTWGTNWYCKQGATNKDGDRRISLSWKVAAIFKSFWVKHAEHTMTYSYAEAIEKINEIANTVYIADVVQFCYSNGVPWHTLAVTGFTKDQKTGKNDIVLSSHTMDSNSRSLLNTLLSYPSNYKLRVYIIKMKE